jgi:dTDP-4-dehydrorhamnose reductase
MRSGGIWITGAGGLIGNYLVQTAARYCPGRRIIPLTRPELELTDLEAVRSHWRRDQPGAIVHCAAMSRSPECQKAPDLARKVNVEATANLAELAAAVPFVFISTDLVFDGRAGNYVETAPVNPLSVYAQTKAAAERLILANPLHSVVRTSLNSGVSPTHDRGLDEQLLKSWKAGNILTLFTDEFRSPIPAEITARAVWELLAKSKTGLYHIAGSERLSRWQIGQILAARWPSLKASLQPGSITEWKGAPREAFLSFPLPRWSEYWPKAEAPEPPEPWK